MVMPTLASGPTVGIKRKKHIFEKNIDYVGKLPIAIDIEG